jgi:hypothetical protein
MLCGTGNSPRPERVKEKDFCKIAISGGRREYASKNFLRSALNRIVHDQSCGLGYPFFWSCFVAVCNRRKGHVEVNREARNGSEERESTLCGE